MSPCHHSFGQQRHTRSAPLHSTPLHSTRLLCSALLACSVVSFYTPKTPWGLPVVLDMFSFACVVFVSWHFFFLPLTERRSCALYCEVKGQKKEEKGDREGGREQYSTSTFQSTHTTPCCMIIIALTSFLFFFSFTDPFDHRLCTARTGSFQRNWTPSVTPRS